MRRTNAQQAAWRFIHKTVDRCQANGSATIARVLASCSCPHSRFDAAVEAMRQHARVVLHFHPDRIGVKPITVVEALLAEGQYRSQFETGLSSGGLTAFPGGARDAWEKALFGGAYHGSESSNADRPKYGALELIRYSDGPWPRFGSCYFVLRPDVSRRSSFTFSGSEQPDASNRLGTIDRMECVFAPLLMEVASGEGAHVPWPPFVAPALGLKNLTIPVLLERISNDLAMPRANPSNGAAGRVLDTGIEAQVHGPIDLKRDVESLVADPAFAETETGDCLRELALKYDFPLEWHQGFRLAVRDVPEEFRGPAIPRLARRLMGDGVIDAAVIGAAQRSLRLYPEDWRDWGTQEDTLQHLRQLWHVLVHYGQPAVPRGATA
jgi:hypothetical protein